MTLIQFTPDDVSRQAAIDAHRGTSWSPEQRAKGIINSYISHMQAVAEEFEPWATGDNRQELAEALEAYRAGYLRRLHAYLHSHSRVLSQMITGAGGWNGRMVRTNRKRSDSADRRRNEWLEWSRKRLERLRRRYDPKRRARAPISSDDPDAVTRLEAKIAQAEELQETMKAANRIVRKKSLSDDEKIAALIAAFGWSESTARRLLEPDYMGKVGFPAYKLQNNNANIRRMKQRIQDLKRLDARPGGETELANGVTVVDDDQLNRVQIYFPAKPGAGLRGALKAAGFRWAPSYGAWQRQRNERALQLAREIAAQYED